ncbi:MAG: MBL fold metallo-hydrolase [Panacagrimonas sp.]
MNELRLSDHGHGIHSLDSGFLRPRLDAIHLMVENGRAAFIDTGTNYSVPRMRAALEQLGLAATSVDYVIVTHVHLDHAGGAGLLMQQLPDARLVVHPRGAPHMVDPTKLWAGTVGVYGEVRARRDYGEVLPVPHDRLIEAPDGFELQLAGRVLRFIDTPGHAKHHFCVYDERARACFTGDTFGLSYRELDQDGRVFIFPTTTPVQFDPPALHASIDRLLQLSPRAMFLTHYSEVHDVPRLGDDLHRLIDAHAALGESVAQLADPAERLARLTAGVQHLIESEARRNGGDPAHWVAVFVNDIGLNAAGIAAWLDSRKRVVASR